MLEETGTVMETDGDYILVETQSRSACSSCSAGESGGCGTSTVGKFFGVKRNHLRVSNTLNAKPGQQVVVGIPDEVLTAVSVRAYVWPLLSMLGLTGLSAWLDMGQVMQGLMAMAGLVLGLALMGWASNNRKTQTRYAPQLIRLAGSVGMAIDTSALMRKTQ